MKKINLLLGFILASCVLYSQTYFIETFDDNEANGWTLEDQWAVGDFTSMPGLNGGNNHNSTFLGFDDYSADKTMSGVV